MLFSILRLKTQPHCNSLPAASHAGDIPDHPISSGYDGQAGRVYVTSDVLPATLTNTRISV